MTILYMTIPFLLVAGSLLAIGQWWAKGGWDGLTYAVYAAAVAALWAVVVLAYCAWVLVRDGIQTSSILPAAILGIALVAAGIWGGKYLLDRHHCARARVFIEALSHAAPDERVTLIEDNRRYVADPTWCGIAAIGYWLGLDPEGRPVTPVGEAERLAALTQLLDAGLAPDDRLLYSAADNGDVAGVRLLMARRAASNEQAGSARWAPSPVHSAEAALRGYERAAFAADAAGTERYSGVLRLFVTGGGDLCGATPAGSAFTRRMDRAGVPYRDWLPDGAGGCSETIR